MNFQAPEFRETEPRARTSACLTESAFNDYNPANVESLYDTHNS